MAAAEPRWQRFTAAFAGRLDGGQIADLLWMAQLLAEEITFPDSSASEEESGVTDPAPRATGRPAADSALLAGRDDSDTTTHTSADQEPPPAPPPPEALVEPASGAADPPTPPTPRVGVAEAGLLRRPRQIGRALAPLSRRVPSGPATLLDVPATVEAIARARLEGSPWRPVLRPRLEPWLSLHLLFDRHPSMALWQRLRRELPRTLGQEARWRDLRRWSLAPGADGRVTLRDLQGRRCPPRRLRQLDGRNVLLVVSDAIAPGWRDGRIAALLQTWAEQQPLLLLQVLPPRLWPRTGLGEQEAGWVQARGPLRPNSRLSWQPFETDLFELEENPLPEPGSAQVPLAKPPAPLTLPLVTLDVEDLAAMARLLAGWAGNSLRGFRLALPDDPLAPAPPAPPAAEAAPPPSGEVIEQQLALFLFSASPGARRLLALLSFAPVITLPVVRLVQRQVRDSGPTQIAEVLFSGLFRNTAPTPAATASTAGGQRPIPVDRQLLCFAEEGLRPRVREGLRVGEARDVYDAVRRHVSASLNLSVDDFEAVLKKAPAARASKDPALLEAFARVAPSCLRGLGANYEQLADEIERAWQPDPSPEPSPEPEPESEPEPEPEPQPWPELRPVAFETARLEEVPLEPLRFTTVTIEAAPLKRFLPSGQRVRISPPVEKTTWCLRQALSDEEDPTGEALTLTLVEIPAGSFLMGSSSKELERRSNEEPQHEVRLASFLMSQTPISQAQWKTVAQWTERPGERWGRELKADPSRFQAARTGEARLLKGEETTDQRPVERVSWEDAMEFCHRLRQRTGRHYTLPSEAQWEYACRASTTTPFHFGETMTPELANYDATYTYANGPKGEYRRQTTPVAMFPANAWGLMDMHGNVWEWCLDHWHSRYEEAPKDGSAWVEQEGDMRTKTRLLRGGSWVDFPGICRSAFRDLGRPVDAGSSIGFRVVCLPQGPSLNP